MFADIKSKMPPRSGSLYPSYGRFVEPDPIGYEDGPNLYGYVRNDPINFIDPTGTKLVWKPKFACVAGNCGWTGYYDWEPDNAPVIVGGNGGGHGGGAGPRTRPKPTVTKPRPFTCADALKEPGEISVKAAGVSLIGAIGWVGSTGTWKNLATGTHGTFATFGFGAGLAAGGTATPQSFSSLQAFNGMSDGFNAGLSMSLGPVSVGLGYSAAWNSSGSGGGLDLDIGPASLPGASFAGTWTDTKLTSCQRGN